MLIKMLIKKKIVIIILIATFLSFLITSIFLTNFVKQSINNENNLIPPGYNSNYFDYQFNNSEVELELSDKDKYRVISDFYSQFQPGMTISEYISRVGSPNSISGSGITYYNFITPEGSISISPLVSGGVNTNLEESEIKNFGFFPKNTIQKDYFATEQENFISINDLSSLQKGIAMQQVTDELGKPARLQNFTSHSFVYNLEDGRVGILIFLSENNLEAIVIQESIEDFGSGVYI